MKSMNFVKSLLGKNNPTIEQGFIRLTIGLSIFTYFCWSILNSSISSDPINFIENNEFILSALYATFAVVMYILIRIYSHLHVQLRITATVVDFCFLTIAFTTITENILPFIFIYLWIPVGNGFRFGVRELFYSTTLAITSFITVLFYSNYWQSHESLGVGILILLLVIPTYVSLFLKRLHLVHEKLESEIKRADAANHAKDEFLANMSHELRTPLNSVLNISETLADTKLDGKQREYLNVIQTCTSLLREHINHILEYAKFEYTTSTLDNQLFNVKELLNRVQVILQESANSKGLEFSIHHTESCPATLRGDSGKISQVLINLASNAIKFTEKGFVRIDTQYSETTEFSGELRIDITDSGIGIPDNQQSRIFSRFFQVDPSKTRRHGGSGLGTAICKKLVEALGGKIGFSSNEKIGSRFWYTVPVTVPTHEVAASFTSSVYLVSTNQKHKDLFSDSMALWGFSLKFYNNIQSMISTLKTTNEKPLAIIIDSSTTLAIGEISIAQEYCDPLSTNYILLAYSSNISDKHMDKFNHILTTPVDTKMLYVLLKESGTTTPYTEKNINPINKDSNHKIGRPLHILVGDDQETNQYVYRQILEKYGHHVTTVRAGDEALSMLEEARVDLAILDLHMPGLSGIDVIKMFRFTSPDRKIPFIIITANTTESAIKECIEVADGYLSKPIERTKLLQTIKIIMSRAEYVEQATHAPDLGIFEQFNLFERDYYFSHADLYEDNFISSLFSVFSHDCAELIATAASALQKGEQEKLSDTLHAIKGIASDIRAVRLSKIASYAHDKLQNSTTNTEIISSLLNHLSTTFMDTQVELKQFIHAIQKNNA